MKKSDVQVYVTFFIFFHFCLCTMRKRDQPCSTRQVPQKQSLSTDEYSQLSNSFGSSASFEPRLAVQSADVDVRDAPTMAASRI